MSIRIHRKRKQFTGDPARVIAKIFRVGGDKRAKEMIDRILAQPETEIEDHLENLLIEFSDRHHNFESILLGNFEKIKSLYSNAQGLSQAKKLLIGSYFTQEYSVESAALFNPSIINHPDQTNLAPGSVRFITSLRATGEGHLSSIVFRSGVLDAHHKLMLDSVSPYIETPKFELNPKYDKRSFLSKLHELHRNGKYSPLIFDSLDNSFSYKSLESRIKKIRSEHPNSGKLTETIDTIKWIAQSNYEIRFRDETLLSERVIFPIIANESKGIEDARFVQFQDSGNKACYYATYTAYNGHSILPMLMHTNDFKRFKMHTLHGDIAHDKGMALFPRKINGNYAMVSRHDGENLFVSFSKNIHIWDVADPIQFSRSSWEFVQTGNCGSPIETEKGWLLITHGVGSMRRYCIDAKLLDLKDPTRVIGSLKEPLITPNEFEREGYVPNVVYSCGSIVHNGSLILPYAVSDTCSRIAIIKLSEILAAMEPYQKPKQTKKKGMNPQ